MLAERRAESIIWFSVKTARIFTFFESANLNLKHRSSVSKAILFSFLNELKSTKFNWKISVHSNKGEFRLNSSYLISFVNCMPETVIRLKSIACVQGWWIHCVERQPQNRVSSLSDCRPFTLPLSVGFSWVISSMNTESVIESQMRMCHIVKRRASPKSILTNVYLVLSFYSYHSFKLHTHSVWSIEMNWVSALTHKKNLEREKRALCIYYVLCVVESLSLSLCIAQWE